MRYGHKYLQDLFADIGGNLGYSTKRNFSPQNPTDGVWLSKNPLNATEQLPIVAIEIIVSESPKTARGSVCTLENVSPSTAIILIHEEEIRRRLISSGLNEDQVNVRIANLRHHIEIEVMKSKQRFQVWNEKNLYYLKRVYNLAN